ncbi:hypothetical protein CPY53_04095 [Paenibacillus polymyxa]|uniref:hypothetical protein n=1 Tax=Paenibacillus polymyxa TaxID=1406 RepID=UPI001F598924|nr:hypothetical protein [Paenibacillus polymyxa]UNL92787.1 hypothetical protein CPY53_04095 [Paenibacillus polymyxa]
MLSNITVIPDESLGGIEREYREVKRKAVTGERIKITAGHGAFFGQDFRRTIHEVTDVVGFNVKTTGKWKDGSVLNPSHDDYVVLEPTDIVHLPIKGRISGTERFRMVDRKAAVGERVIMTAATGTRIEGGRSVPDYNNGDIFEIARINDGADLAISTSEKLFYHREYHVLESLTAAPLLSEQSAQDQAAATISALALRLDALTERMDALEAQVTQVAQPTTTVDTEVVLKAVRRFSEGLKRSVSDALKTPQQHRDEIVELAKADVKELAQKDGKYLVPTSFVNNYVTNVEFIVNRDKRKVTAILRGVASDKVRAVGRAKCAPNDVFNAHIGKAISLRRALGLDVPAEYLNVPKPTEVRKGDAVRSTSGIYAGVKGYVDKITYGDSSPSGVFFKHSRANRRDGRIYKSIRFVEVIDDTREEVAA